jgi:DNA topoisomerase-1
VPDRAKTARTAGLYYVNDGDAGLRRLSKGRRFRLQHSTGKPVADDRVIERVKRLTIPPAWTDVWICASPRGHIQAVGRDARGRKQYLYHPEWRRIRDRSKFDRLLAFGRALSRIRARVDRDLARRSLGKPRVLAAIIRLLDIAHVRVGNEEYARANGSFGVTTFRDRHVRVTPTTLAFEFRAKSGKRQRIALSDRRLARIVKACQDLPGQQLFRYLDDDGTPRSITSSDVNAYLREIAGDDVSAKDFRTWAGTVLAGAALSEFGPCAGKATARRNLAAAVKRVAGRLGNTPAICRKCYIHPAVMAAYEDGIVPLRPTPRAGATGRSRRLSSEEAALLRFLSALPSRLVRDSGATPRRLGRGR